jgi:hypothetical protein
VRSLSDRYNLFGLGHKKPLLVVAVGLIALSTPPMFLIDHLPPMSPQALAIFVSVCSAVFSLGE